MAAAIDRDFSGDQDRSDLAWRHWSPRDGI